MLREKLKGRLLKPLLFLLALFAIQQTASAYSSIQFRSKNGSTSATMVWNPAEKAYETTVTADRNEAFGVFCTADENNGEPGTPEVSGPAIYILDKTGWEDLAVYVWGPGDALGGWPGTKADPVVINGVTYQKVEIPANGNGGYHVIFNNNDNGEQFDGPEISFDRSYCYEITYAGDGNGTCEGRPLPEGIDSGVTGGGNTGGDVWYACHTDWDYGVNDDPTYTWPLVPTDQKSIIFYQDKADYKITVKTEGNVEGGKPIQIIVAKDNGTVTPPDPVEPVEPVDPDAYNYIFLRSCADNWGDNIVEGLIWNSTTNAYELKNFHNAGNDRAYGVVISNGMNSNNKAVDYRWYFYGSGNTPFHIADNADIVLNPDPEDQVHREIYLDNEGWYNITVKTNGDVPTGAPVQFIITKVANPGMPFFPKGITNERDFRNLPADQEFYYLVCHNINDRKASPEWQMVETVPGSGEYTVDFTYNNHGDGDNGDCFNAGQADTFNVAFFTRDADAPKYKYDGYQDIHVEGQGQYIHKNNHHHAGVRLRATYKPADGTLTFNYLKQTTNGWEIADNATDATYIPFISLVADKWTQPVSNGTKIYGEWAGDWLLPNNYQNAFIQYDENGEIVYSRHGNQVFYNTQWPPVNPIFIEKSFTSNGKEYDLVMDSDNLSFASTGDVKTGAKWAEEFGFNLDGGPYIEGVNHNETLFELYTVNDVWASGDFKLWSGWSGNRDGNQSAEWHKNWNWGHVNQNTTDAENIDNASLFFLGNRNGDVNFSAPTYIKTIRFFMATPNDPNGSAIGNDWGRSFIYLERAMGNVRIQALNNEDYTAGTFLPGLDADLLPQGTTISRINLSVYRSSDETEVGNLWNAIDRNIDPEKFYDAFGTPFTLSDYAETYYNDLFDYQSSGYYFYKMTVTFKDQYGVETSETVRSNPFYVSIATSSLVAAQLVEIVRDENGKAVEERFNDYKYVTYTPGSPYEWGYLTDKAFEARKANYQQEEGRDETGLGRYGYRVEKINLNPTSTLNRQFYADADRALWTNKVLVYSLRPWKGEEPDMALVDAGAHGAYWEITRDKCHDHANWQEGPLEENTWYYGHVAQGNPTLSGDDNFEGLVTKVEDLADLNFDAPLELIIDATCIYKHNFSVKLHYYPTREENETTAESSVAHDDMQLRIPTPRMRPVAFTGTMEDLSVEGENFGKIEIAAEDHTGNKTDEIAYQTNLYDNPRVRTLRFGAYMDMPNATPELIALIPDLGAKATEEQIAAGMMGNYWRKCEIDCAEDKGFEELLDGSFLNIKDMRYTRFRFLNQDLNMWLTYNAETNEYEPRQRNITFDFEYDRTGNGEILFFPRRANGVTFQLQSNLKAPEFAMKDGKIDATAYKVVIPKAGADNAMEEHLILSDVKTITDKDSYLELPGEENTPGSQQIEFTLNEDKAYYMFLLDKSLPVQSTEDGWAEHTRFSHHNNINTAAALYSVDRADRGPWYDGIEGTSVINKDFDVEIAHAYFFYVNRDIDFQHWDGTKWVAEGAVSKTPDNGAATQAAPQRASAADYNDGRYVAFVGPSRVATLNANDIMTGVENITAAGESIISGEGFIDMNGNLGAVYGVDGQLYYNGRGRVELPAGIYMVATEKTNAKVLVK